MRGLNKVMLIGNLGNEPEVKTLEGGTKVARFSLATTESYTNKEGGTITETEWHTIIAWRSLAEVVEKYLRKGSTIYVEGKIKTRSYEDKAGTKRYVTEIIADSMVMLDKPKNL
jgi:single-strand DNA-binding protein